ncbi:AfsA-related hotdog domain-containing protein [Actinacidiphila paucisporea]|uniref:A-factor biosynthesis hotdog domain-containing protein n=1 Tax=Actinacidiphila paucisporea TaxID=310782 RepID=A0A1M7NWW3_9ACTN|nr:AfsA-related hotdog domain-containing protein [Actinacidiphila paucisporea]SHN08581.1 A-factor biosynthesis hotdog domain-containing protein [Actinacidiphila paucisporea]
MPIDPVAALNFDQFVPPTTVNRRSPREVFVTDHTRTGPDEFAIAVRVAHDHPLWSDQRAPWHDPVAMTEAFRQAFVVVRHEYLDVQRGTPSAVQQVTLDVSELDAFRADGSTPLQGVVKVRVTQTDSTFDIAGDFLVGGARAMSLSFGSILFPRESYREIRDYQRSRRALDAGSAPDAKPIDPELVGRRDRGNVVIGPAVRPDRYPLLVDRTHPSFFDRDYDHIPASLLIEAMRQSALRSAAEAGLCAGDAALTRAELDFGIFVEIDVPAECAVSVTGRPGTVAASIGIDQAGVRVASGTLELTELHA